VPKARLEEFKTRRGRHRAPHPAAAHLPTGEFILHLNGVDRVNSASYYTPAVLTETLVRETLKERLKDIGPDAGRRHPVAQRLRARHGLRRLPGGGPGPARRPLPGLKQEQLGRTIDPGDYEDQRRRVMHHIAVHNVYGVDLNPTAVELGALSLWLASIHRLKLRDRRERRAGHLPGLRGTLVRAATAPRQQPDRRPPRGLDRGSNWPRAVLWQQAEAPRQLAPGEARQPGEVYHFLVWDEDMTPAARDTLMRRSGPMTARS
jgi:hypothetical protein